MKRQSRQTDPAISQGSGAGWRIWGELELPQGLEARAMVNAWLPEVLAPLHLPLDFLNRIAKSAEAVVGRAMPPETAGQAQPTRFFIYLPANRPLNVQAWGFFRLEKVEPDAERANARRRSIELYLIPEGQ